MFNRKDKTRNTFQLVGKQGKKGYDWWWHSFTGHHAVTGEEKTFFIEFFTCNPELGEAEPVYGQLGEKKPSYVMIKCGAWGEDSCQLHRFFGWRQAEVNMDVPFKVKAKECYLTENEVIGKVSVSEEQAVKHPEMMSDAGEMEFILKINKRVAFNVGYGAGKLFRKMQLFEMFWHAEGMKTEYDGYVLLNGEKYIVRPETSYGYADKNWGKDFTSPWVWLSSNDLVSEVSGKRLYNSVFDIGGGRPKVGPIALERQLLSAFWYEGREFEFNFSKFWHFTRTAFSCRETEDKILWHVEQKTWRNRMVTDIECLKKEMLLVNYESPDGKKRHNRLWNGGTGSGSVELYHKGHLIDKVHAEHVGCEYGEY